MTKDADYAKSKFEKLEADLQYLGAKQEFLLIFTRI